MISQERLKSLLRYDAESGRFHWIEISGRYGRYPAGTIAGSLEKKGYRRVVLDGKSYKAHRLAWLYVFGEMPDQVDHVNRVKDDNRIANLRPATNRQNSGNVGLRADNTSGYRGVTFNIKNKKYQARLHRKSLGYFDSAEEAARAASSYRAAQYGAFAA